MIKFSTDSIHFEESVCGKFLHIGIVCVGSVSCAPYALEYNPSSDCHLYFERAPTSWNANCQIMECKCTCPESVQYLIRLEVAMINVINGPCESIIPPLL